LIGVPLDTITIPFLLWVLVLMPALGILSWLRLRSGKALPPKVRRYRAMLVLQLLLLAITSLAAKQNSFSLFGPAWPPAWTWVAGAAYLLFIAARIRTGWRKLTEERKQKARMTLPENLVEMRYRGICLPGCGVQRVVPDHRIAWNFPRSLRFDIRRGSYDARMARRDVGGGAGNTLSPCRVADAEPLSGHSVSRGI